MCVFVLRLAREGAVVTAQLGAAVLLELSPGLCHPARARLRLCGGCRPRATRHVHTEPRICIWRLLPWELHTREVQEVHGGKGQRALL